MRTTIKELRELVKKIVLEVSEEEKTLEKWAGDWLDKALAAVGAFPVPRGDRATSAFASGASNDVREVLWKGKRAVARLSYKPDERSKMMELLSYKQLLPSKYRVHFPRVYTTVDIWDPQENAPVYGTIGEMLEPLPAAVLADIQYLKRSSRIPSWRVENVVADADGLELVARAAMRNNNVPLDRSRKAIRDIALPMLWKMSSEGTEALEVAEKLQGALETQLGKDGARTVAREISSLLKRELVPADQSNDPVMDYGSKKFRDFHNFLRALAEAGLPWADLHEDNFMVRPGTGDIVVVDPGQFG